MIYSIWEMTPEKIDENKYDYGMRSFNNKIYKYLVTRENSDTPFSLYEFNRKYVNNAKIMARIVDFITGQLHTAGWKTKIIYGGGQGLSGLLIYDKDHIPPLANGEEI